MTRPRESHLYPVQFFQLADRFEQNPQDAIEVKFDSPAAARRFQLELTSFRSALRKEGTIDSYPNFNHVEIKFSSNKESLILVDKDRTESALAIERALKAINPKKEDDKS